MEGAVSDLHNWTGNDRAPEIWGCSEEELCKHLLRPEVDIWAYGCVLYESATGDILMQGAGRGSCKQVVQEWCRSWSLLAGHVEKRPAFYSHAISESDRLLVRVQKCKPWHVKILQCLTRTDVGGPI